MLKKSLLILFIVFLIICISNISLASNMGNNIKNTVNSGTNTVVDGIGNLAESARNGVGHIENGIEDALTMDNNNLNMDTTTSGTANVTSNYITSRTAATATSGDTTTMWVWIITSIAAIVIVALVWFYGSQNRVD